MTDFENYWVINLAGPLNSFDWGKDFNSASKAFSILPLDTVNGS